MIARIFRWFETRIESFPPERPGIRRRRFWRSSPISSGRSGRRSSCLGCWPAAIALIEVSLLAFVGNLVDC